MEKKSERRELEQISNIFLSTGKKPEENLNQVEDQCKVEENVIVRRNIAYPNTLYAQQDILKSLSKHLEENYRVKRIELKKTDRTSRPGIEKCIEERVTIFIY